MKKKKIIEALAGLLAIVSLCAFGLEPDSDTSLSTMLLIYAAAAATLTASLLTLKHLSQ